jgi:hypothetical protein
VHVTAHAEVAALPLPTCVTQQTVPAAQLAWLLHFSEATSTPASGVTAGHVAPVKHPKFVAPPTFSTQHD